jgi:hypothetical protein
VESRPSQLANNEELVAIEYEASSIEGVPSLPAFGDARSIMIATNPEF